MRVLCAPETLATVTGFMTFTGVSSYVWSEASLSCALIGLTANDCCVRLRVRFSVSTQMLLSAKTFAALTAHVRSIAGVSGHVIT